MVYVTWTKDKYKKSLVEGIEQVREAGRINKMLFHFLKMTRKSFSRQSSEPTASQLSCVSDAISNCL